MNRIDRLTAILIHLQTKQVVTAEEIANRFEISKRTVYRDLRALEEAGVPIGAEAGVGYYISDGYYLPPVMFSKQEAIAMLLAGKLVEKLTDNSTNKDYQSALYKIKSVLSTSDKEFITSLDSRIDIKHIPSLKKDAEEQQYLSCIQNALVSRNVLSIDYQSYYKNELTKEREVEPVGLCYYSFTWHMIGFCRMRDDYRDFRVDRIKAMHTTENVFERRGDDLMDRYFHNLMIANDLMEVIVRFDKQIYSELHSQKYYFGFIDEEEFDNYYEMTFLIDSLSYIGKWLLKFGKSIEIISPEDLKSKMKDFVLELQEKYL